MKMDMYVCMCMYGDAETRALLLSSGPNQGTIFIMCTRITPAFEGVDTYKT